MDRIIELGRQVWSLLTEEEQENYYYNTGTLGFVDVIISLLNINDFDDNDDYCIDSIHDKIFG